ncbi:hypothetical protein [Virgisporangium aurantiacum]|uniref:hypothetical protein n=1 Tax=Virgisporangium aurantiacum TaxID=175570 RepID=UPI00194F8FD8|nr:hypothetical protein [Virgisporangium aurantiacum]
MNDPVPSGSPNSRRRRARGLTVQQLIAVFEATLAGVGGVYLASESMAATAVASAAAVLVLALVLAMRHPDHRRCPRSDES